MDLPIEKDMLYVAANLEQLFYNWHEKRYDILKETIGVIQSTNETGVIMLTMLLHYAKNIASATNEQIENADMENWPDWLTN